MKHEDARARAGVKQKPCAVQSCRQRAAGADMFCARCRRIIDYMVRTALDQLTRNSQASR